MENDGRLSKLMDQRESVGSGGERQHSIETTGKCFFLTAGVYGFSVTGPQVSGGFMASLNRQSTNSGLDLTTTPPLERRLLIRVFKQRNLNLKMIASRHGFMQILYTQFCPLSTQRQGIHTRPAICTRQS